MATKTKHTKQAKALFDLYQTMPENIREEIKEMILRTGINYDEPETSELTRLSNDPLKDVWDTPENDHWDEFFKSKGYV